MSRKGSLNILLFDLYQGGHHVQYLEQLGRYWLRAGLSGRLDVVVHQQVAADDVRLSRLAADSAGTIEIHGLRPRFDLEAGGLLRPARNDLEHGRLLKQAIGMLAPEHCVCMYFDHVQLSLALDLRLHRNVSFSGIYFRPSFHYGSLNGEGWTLRRSARSILKRTLLQLSLRNPSFRYLFCLDPYVLDHLPRHGTNSVAVPLPDGIPFGTADCPREGIKERWDLGPNRKLAVLFGVLDERKGIRQVLESGLLLPPDVQSNLAVLFAGPLRGNVDWLAPLIQQLEDETSIRIILDNRFVPGDEAAALLAASDFVLVPYQKHVGSSNVLIRAAKARRPVLGQDFGLMGEEIRRKKLGLAVDTQSPAAIAGALALFVRHPDEVPFDLESADAYAAANTEEAYARTIFDHLYSS